MVAANLMILSLLVLWMGQVTALKDQNEQLSKIDYAINQGLGIFAAPKPDKTTGSGAPSGKHYNLNIIGVPKDKTADMQGGGGRVIFVPREGKSKINLYEGDDYLVLDKNGTDGKAAFQLPNPDADNDGVTTYSVWARALGKPGGMSTTTTCAVDVGGEEWCSVYSMVQVREKGKQSFSDVSRELLYVYVDLDGDGKVERYSIFDDSLMDYFWDYDNNGLHLLQLRFYPIASDVN